MRTVSFNWALDTARGAATNKWIEALGLDLHIVLGGQDALIDDDNGTVTMIVFDDVNGVRTAWQNDKGEWDGFRKKQITVPLTADPSDYGLITAVRQSA